MDWLYVILTRCLDLTLCKFEARKSELQPPNVSWPTRNLFLQFLADRTEWSAIGIILSSLHLFVCPSVCDAVHCGAQGGCRRLKVTPFVPRTALAIPFFRHFAVAWDVWRIVHPHTTHSKSRTAEISASGIAMGSVVTWPWLFDTRHFRRVIWFDLIWFDWIVRSTIGYRSNSWAFC